MRFAIVILSMLTVLTADALATCRVQRVKQQVVKEVFVPAYIAYPVYSISYAPPPIQQPAQPQAAPEPQEQGLSLDDLRAIIREEIKAALSGQPPAVETPKDGWAVLYAKCAECHQVGRKTEKNFALFDEAGKPVPLSVQERRLIEIVLKTDFMPRKPHPPLTPEEKSLALGVLK